MSKFFVDAPLLSRAFNHSLGFLKGLGERHVGARASREELLSELGGTLPVQGENSSAVIDLLARQGERGAVGSAGPRYFGFVIGGTLPTALAADWLTSSWDQNAGLFATSPVSSVVEEVAAGWVLELLGLPAQASVGFVTGCQMAHLTGLAAARHAVLQRAGWNVEEEGLQGAPPVQIVTGAESHVTVDVALRMLGFGTRSAKRVPTDGQGRMQPDALRAALSGSTGPTIVCAQVGNVNTGACDPVGELAEVAHAAGAWLHVDGAFGLWARASSALQPLVAGVERADSWATDGHKWLNVPYDCGIAMVKDRAAHRAAMTSSAAYLEQTEGKVRDGIDTSPEFSRRARGIPVYAALRTLGRSGVEDLVERGCARARQMAELLRKDRRVEILNEVVLNQVLVRFRPKSGSPDELTRQVVARVQEDGTCWLSGTTWHQMAAMRISFSHWATSEEDVEASAAAILRALASADL